jgi:protein involved in polysaccharide export with SLBB domain
MFAALVAGFGTSGQNLEQFGYSLFEKPTAPSLATIGDDYVLGPGDSLVLYLWGDPVDIKEISASYSLSVDRNGFIFLPAAGQIAVWGQDLASVRAVIKSMLDRRYKKLEMSLTLAGLRQFPVFVSGFAGAPGTVLATGADTLLTVLSRAGGIKKTGSLRAVELNRAGKDDAEKIQIDFYDSLINGNSLDMRVREGDSIFVPGIGPTVALSGELRRPGIYELKGQTSLAAVLELAGGALPSARSGAVSLLEFSESGRSLLSGDLTSAAFTSRAAVDGDLIHVGRASELLVGQVQLSGSVKYPGRYDVATFSTLYALLRNAQLLPETNLSYGRVYRMDSSGRDRSFVFSPKDVLAGADMALAEFDRVVLYRYNDVSIDPDFDRFADTVVISGPVKYPGFYMYRGGLSLAALMADNALNLDANPYYAEITRKGVAGVDEYYTFSPEEIVSGAKDIPLLRFDRLRFVQRGADAITHNFDKFSEAVSLTGQVARPEVFALRNGMKLSSLLTKDQLLYDTNLNYAEITRLRADGKNEYITFRPSEVLEGAWDLELGAADKVRLVRVGYAPADVDLDRFKDAVHVTGPAQFTGLYAWREGMKLSGLLAKAKPSLLINQVYAEILRPLGGDAFEYLTFSPKEVASGIFDLTLKARDSVRLYSTVPATGAKQGTETTEEKETSSMLGTGEEVAETAEAPVADAESQAASQAVAAAESSLAAESSITGQMGSEVSADLGRFLEVVRVSGAVRYTGPWARTPSLKLSSVITADQMLEETNLDYAELTRLKEDGSYEYLTFVPKDVLDKKFDLALRARDTIRLLRKTFFGGTPVATDMEKFGSAVRLVGQIARPEVFALREGMKLSSLLTKDQLLLDTNLNYAEITRPRADGKNEYITFRPSEVLDGSWDFELGPRDMVRLHKVAYAPENPDFDRFNDAVMITGPARFSGLYTWREGMTLSSLLASAKPTLEANRYYAEIVHHVGGTEFEYLTFAPREILSKAADLELKARDVVRLYSAVGTENGGVPAGSAGNFIETVRVSGTVRYVGPYARTEGLKLSSIIMKDQLLPETNLEYAELTRLKDDGSQEYLAFSPNDVLAENFDLDLRAGDSLRFIARTGFKGVKEAADLDKFTDIVQLAGTIARPEVFALKPGMKLSSLLTKEQLLLDTNLNYAEITRYKADGKNEYITFRPSELLNGSWDMKLGARDLVRLYKVGYAPEKHDFDRFTNAVQLYGPVKFPGLYAWREGMKLSSLLENAGPALETNQVYAEIVRPLGGTAFEYITFAPREIASKQADLTLKARDVVRLYTTVPAIANKLSTEDQEGSAEAAETEVTAAVEAVNVQAEIAAATAPIQAEAQAPAVTQTPAVGQAPAVAQTPAVAQAPAATQVSASETAPTASVLNVGDISADSAMRFFEVVTVSGTVRYVGPYARTEGLKLSSILTKDQLLEETNLEYAELTRLKEDGTAEYIAISPRAVLDGSFDLMLKARDSIRLVSKTGFKGTKALIDLDRFVNVVQLSGQVARPEIFAQREGMKLSSIVKSDQILLDTNLNYAELTRIRRDGKNEYITFSPSEVLDGSWDLELGARDIVRMHKVAYAPENPDFDRFKDAVLINGPVQFPGLYAWKEGTKLSSLQKLASIILDTNQVYADIMRPLPGGKSQLITFAPREVAEGVFDLELMQKDTLRFYSMAEMKEAKAKAREAPVFQLPVGETGLVAGGTTVGASTSAMPTTATVPTTGSVQSGNVTVSGLGTLGAVGSTSAATESQGFYVEIVNVSGPVAYEGPYARTPSLKLSSVVTVDQMLSNTNLDYAELSRRKADGAWEYLSFSPRKVLTGEFDLDLRAQDLIRFVELGYMPEKPDFDRYGNAYALLGAVRNPGLYSMTESLPLSDVITVEQLLGATDIHYAEIERWVPGGQKEYLTFSPLAVLLGEQDFKIFPRDLVRLRVSEVSVTEHDFARYPNTVLISGVVRHQGRYAWYEGLSLTDLISADDILIDTNIEYAELRRRGFSDESVSSFSPRALVEGAFDAELQPRDMVVFYPKYFNKPVTIAGAVQENKVIPYYEGLELSTVLRSVVLGKSIDTLKAVITKPSGERQTVYLETYYRKQSASKVILNPGDTVAIEELLPEENLPVVTVRGAVKNPQTLAYREGMKLMDALESAGDYDARAYPYGLVLIRKTAAETQQKQVDRLIAQLDAASVAGAALPSSTDSSLSSAAAVVANLQIDLAVQRAKLGSLRQLYKEGFGRISLEIPDTLEALAQSSSNIMLERDDLIFVPTTPSYVMVSGQVADQNVVVFREGMTVRQALAESGWISAEADMAKAYIVRASGRLDSTEGKRGFLWFKPTILKYSLRPGDTVVVPSKAVKVSVAWSYIKDGLSVVSTILTSALTAVTLLGL